MNYGNLFSRALPPRKSLFDEHVHPVIKSQAELMRDLACQTPNSAKRPSTSKVTHVAAHSPAKKVAHNKSYKGKGGRNSDSVKGKAKQQNKSKSMSSKQSNL